MRPIITEVDRAVARALYALYGGIPERADEALESFYAERERFPLMFMETFLNRHPEFRPKDWGQTPEERAILAQYGPGALSRPRKP